MHTFFAYFSLRRLQPGQPCRSTRPPGVQPKASFVGVQSKGNDFLVGKFIIEQFFAHEYHQRDVIKMYFSYTAVSAGLEAVPDPLRRKNFFIYSTFSEPGVDIKHHLVRSTPVALLSPGDRLLRRRSGEQGRSWQFSRSRRRFGGSRWCIGNSRWRFGRSRWRISGSRWRFGRSR